jgi:hypothetical protein
LALREARGDAKLRDRRGNHPFGKILKATLKFWPLPANLQDPLRRMTFAAVDTARLDAV